MTCRATLPLPFRAISSPTLSFGLRRSFAPPPPCTASNSGGAPTSKNFPPRPAAGGPLSAAGGGVKVRSRASSVKRETRSDCGQASLAPHLDPTPLACRFLPGSYRFVPLARRGCRWPAVSIRRDDMSRALHPARKGRLPEGSRPGLGRSGMGARPQCRRGSPCVSALSYLGAARGGEEGGRGEEVWGSVLVG